MSLRTDRRRRQVDIRKSIILDGNRVSRSSHSDVLTTRLEIGSWLYLRYVNDSGVSVQYEVDSGVGVSSGD